MKEFSIEEKAKAYDEAIKKAKEFKNNPFAGYDGADLISSLFPELIENKEELEDEKIRKALIDYFSNFHLQTFAGLDPKKILAWLEKQGDKYDKIVEKAKSEKQRVLITETNGNAGIDWDTRSLADTKMLLEYGLDFINKKLEKQSEQKPADKVEPKFKVGDTVKDPYGDLYHITEITDDSYKTDDGRFILFKNQEVYTLSNFTAWSKEDENIKESIITGLEMLKDGASDKSLIALYNKKIDWLKSLKERYIWKPSDEQMLAINTAINVVGKGTINGKYLVELHEQLKKLKG